MKKEHEGFCRLCGQYKKLSFEHIPPRSAFNDQQRVFQTMQDFVSGRGYSKFRGGIGKYSICEACNNRTGAWYGVAFADWARQGLEWLDKIESNTLFDLPYYIKPLNVIKQIIVMALAMSPENTVPFESELAGFVLNREQKYLPPKEKVYVYFNQDGHPRFASGAVIMNTKTGSGAFVRAEISLRPFGYCVCSPVRKTKLLASSQGLCDISWFSEFDYNVWTEVYLRLPLLETHEPFPLDYRTKTEIEEEFTRNQGGRRL